MESLLEDLRLAIRSLARNPGFTAVSVLTLALGIGATTTVFSVVYGVLFRPLSFPGAGPGSCRSCRSRQRVQTLSIGWGSLQISF